MKKKEFLTEAKRKAIIADKEKAIIESFVKTFNKIKRIDENEINEAVTAEDKLNELIGKPISLIRTLHTLGRYNQETGALDKVTEDKQIDGVIGEIVDERAAKGLKVMNSQGGKIAFLMYDNMLYKNKHSGSFIEGDSTFKYTYKGADETSERILQFILRYLVGSVVKLSEEGIEGVNGQSVIPAEIFQMEEFETNDYDLVELNLGQDDSKLEMEFGYIETEQGCFYLKATVEFYINISGSYRAATHYDPEEGPEEEFGDGDVVEMKYVECSGDQEYQLTDEMKQIARPHVLKAFDDLREYISEKAWERLEDGRDDGPDGDDYDDRDDAREWGGVDGW